MHVSAEQLVGALRSAGLRITGPRRAVCQVLAQSHHEHLSALDIGEAANRAAGVSIDESTIYRTLDTLEALGYLHHVHLGHGPGVVHLSDRTDHHHLVCEECGRTVDLPLTEVEPVLNRLTLQHGFDAGSLHFALVGRCRDCARKVRP